jgi:hypothetical protein
MSDIGSHASSRSTARYWLAGGLAAVAAAALLVSMPSAGALDTPVGLGTAASFGVLANTTVTNTGPTVITGNLGLSPGTSVTGFAPGIVNGTQYIADATAAGAQTDLTTAYNQAAALPTTQDLSGTDLGGLTLPSGVYNFSSSAQLTGALTLNAQGDPNAVFVFNIGSTLTTASASSVVLINDAQACNVFWRVGSSATLGTTTAFQGSILALASVTLNTGATMIGRALARTAAVTMDTNTITAPSCAPVVVPAPTTATPTRSTPAPSPRHTPAPSPAPTPGGLGPAPAPSPGSGNFSVTG